MPEWFRRRGYLTAAFLSEADLRYGPLISSLFQEAFYGDRPLPSWSSAYTPEKACQLAIEWIGRNQNRPHLVLLNLAEPLPPYQPPPPFDLHYMNHPYDGEIAGLDEQIGLFVHRLKSAGLFENSILVFTAPFARAPEDKILESPLQDTTVKVPLFVVAPGLLPRQKEYAAATSLADIFPTILSLMEIEPAGLKFDGVPLFEKGSSAEVRRNFIFGAAQSPRLLGLPPLLYGRSSEWKLLWGADDQVYSVKSGSLSQTESAKAAASSMKEELRKMGVDLRSPGAAQVSAAAATAVVDTATEELLEAGPDAALAILQDARELPATPALLLLQSEMAASAGRLPLALELAQSAHRKAASPLALAVQARIRLAGLQYREARDLMQKYSNSVLHMSYYDNYTMGVVLSRLGECNEAMEQLGKTIVENPRFAAAYLERGRCYTAEGKTGPALADFRKAAELEPQNPVLTQELVSALIESPAPQDAAPFLRRLLELNPRDYQAMLQLARLLSDAGDKAEANRLCRDVITQSGDPTLIQEARKFIAQ